MPAAAAFPTEERISIALIDDDIVLRRRLQLLLQASDYEVRAYSRAATLFADPAPRTRVYLISDLKMPATDGFDLLRGLRASGRFEPAILITSSHAADLPAKAVGEGFFAMLTKPLADRTVVEAVRRAVASQVISSN